MEISRSTLEASREWSTSTSIEMTRWLLRRSMMGQWPWTSKEPMEHYYKWLLKIISSLLNLLIKMATPLSFHLMGTSSLSLGWSLIWLATSSWLRNRLFKGMPTVRTIGEEWPPVILHIQKRLLLMTPMLMTHIPMITLLITATMSITQTPRLTPLQALTPWQISRSTRRITKSKPP